MCSLGNNRCTFELNQIIGEARQAFRIAGGISLFQFYVFSLDPSELFECLRECKEPALRLRVRFRRASEDANYPSALLRSGQPRTSQVAATVPSVVMNSRRLISAPALTPRDRINSHVHAGRGKREANVRFGSLADICSAKGHVRFAPNSDRESGFPPPESVQYPMSALGQKRTFRHIRLDTLVADCSGLLFLAGGRYAFGL